MIRCLEPFSRFCECFYASRGGVGLPHPLGLGVAGHELADRVEGVEVLEKDAVDLFADGHLDSILLGQGDDGLGGGDAFDDARDFFGN